MTSKTETTPSVASAVATAALQKLIQHRVNPTAGEYEDLLHWVNERFGERIAHRPPAPPVRWPRARSAWRHLRAAWQALTGPASHE